MSVTVLHNCSFVSVKSWKKNKLLCYCLFSTIQTFPSTVSVALSERFLGGVVLKKSKENLAEALEGDTYHAGRKNYN